MRPLMLSVLVMCALAFAASAAGPFGFERGMTKEQVIALVGKGAVQPLPPEISEDCLVLATAPKPHADFGTYILMFSPERGLLKILAVGKTVQTNRYGVALKTAFDEVRSALAGTYGPPSKNYDRLNAGSIWNEPEDWMMGLRKEERVLAAFWEKSLPNRMEGLGLTAHAESMETGYLNLHYFFVGLAEYIAAKKANAGKVF